MSIDNKKKAVIHIAKQKLGLSDAEYRDMLLSIAGVSSSVNLTDVTFDRVMNRFHQLGFKSGPKHNKRPRPQFDRLSPKTKDRIMSKIEAQVLDMGLWWDYADGIAKQMFKVDYVEFCDPKKLQKIVAALAYRQKRAGVKGQVSGVRCQEGKSRCRPKPET